MRGDGALTAGCIDTDLPAGRRNFGQYDGLLIETVHVRSMRCGSRSLKPAVMAPSLLLHSLIHRSAWNTNSANFAFWGFCEVRRHGVLGSSNRV
jgi:hypothetical protein